MNLIKLNRIKLDLVQNSMENCVRVWMLKRIQIENDHHQQYLNWRWTKQKEIDATFLFAQILQKLVELTEIRNEPYINL